MAKEDIQSRILNAEADLLDTDMISSAMADSNATGWELDAIKVIDVTSTGARTYARFRFTLKGEQKEGRAFSGDTIRGEAAAEITDSDVNFTVYKLRRS
jgi:hypothetical protein